MPSWIDGSLYPDTDVPEEITTLEDRVDFLARLCGAWDFGILPEADTVAEIRRAEWRQSVEATNLLTSPAYHLLRKWHALPPVHFLGQEIAHIRDDPSLRFV